MLKWVFKEDSSYNKFEKAFNKKQTLQQQIAFSDNL